MSEVASIWRRKVWIFDCHPGTLANLLRYFDTGEFEVTVYVPLGWELYQQKELITFADLFNFVEDPDLPHARQTKGLIGWGIELFRERRWFRSQIQFAQPDLVLIGAITPGRMLAAVPRSIRKIYFLHSLPLGNRHKWFGKFWGLIARIYQVHLVVNSDYALHLLFRNWGFTANSNSISQIPLTSQLCQKDRVRSSAKENLSVVQVSGLYDWKAPLDFIRMTKIVREMLSTKSVHFSLVGAGDLLDEVLDFVALHNLESCVTIYNKVPPLTVELLLSEADVYVQSSRVDNFPISVLDAMALGLPAVVTASGGMVEQVDNNVSGFVVPTSRPEMLASAVIELLVNGDLRKKMGQESRARFEKHFSRDIFDQRFRDLLGKIEVT